MVSIPSRRVGDFSDRTNAFSDIAVSIPSRRVGDLAVSDARLAVQGFHPLKAGRRP